MRGLRWLVSKCLVVAIWIAATAAVAQADAQARLAELLTGPRGIAHRTASLETLLNTGWLLSAYDAGKRNLLATHELPFRQRARVAFGGGGRLHTEIFATTRGILPADTAYGKYGVVWASDAHQPSPYLNSIPNEVIVEGRASLRSAIFIVPRAELAGWQARFPRREFLAEDAVPRAFVLPAKRWSVLPGRIARRLRELVRLRVPPIAGKQRTL